ncbi:MAG TPA: hypothetical protein VHG93_25555 [Longimicrobium sp.]|nr:hypothetical protein [Longimicrobium sp.]
MFTRFVVLSILLGAALPAAAQAAGPLPRRVASIGRFQTPESVRYGPAQDVFFVSNIADNPSALDGVGFISRLGRRSGTPVAVAVLWERRP